MKGDGSPASAVRRQLSLQQRAVEQLRALWALPGVKRHQTGDTEMRAVFPPDSLEPLGKPYRLRVQVDAEGFPFIPGRYGQIEWHCDGVNCWSCALPGQLALAVYSDRPRLWAIPGVRRHQTGDTEMRAVFLPDALEQVALVIKARRRRSAVARRGPPARVQTHTQSDFRTLETTTDGHRGPRAG